MAESLIIELDAKTSKLDKKLKEVDSRLEKIEGSTKKADKAFLGLKKAGALAAEGVLMLSKAGLAATAAMGAAAKVAIDYTRELQVAIDRSGESAERLQQLAFASGTVGISLEKLGDITKDTNEKIGEFLTTGGGGFQDFADVMGLTKEQAEETAKELGNLSGSEILQTLVTRMEAAGKSTKEISFALEGLASDTTDLIPLLSNGGEELNKLTEKFDALNASLSQSEIDKIKKLGKETALLGTAISGTSNKVIAGLADDISQVTSFMAENVNAVGELVLKAVKGYQLLVTKALVNVGDLFREAEIKAVEAKLFIAKELGSDVLDGVGDAAENAGRALEVLFNPAMAIKRLFEETSDEVETVDNSVKSLEETLNRLKESDAALDLGDLELVNEQLREIKITLDEFNGEDGEDEEDDTSKIEKKTSAEEESNKRIIDSEKRAQKERDRLAKIEKANALAAKAVKEKSAKDAMALAGVLFEDNKAVSSGMAVVNTAVGVTRAFSDLGWPAGIPAAALAVATGAAQIAAIQGASKGSTSVAPVGGGGGVSSSQQSFEPETSSLDITDQGGEGVSQLNITIGTEDGTDLIAGVSAQQEELAENGQ